MIKTCQAPDCGKLYMTDKRHSGGFFRYCPDCRKKMNRINRYTKYVPGAAKAEVANTGELEFLIHWSCEGSTHPFRPLTNHWLTEST